MTKSQKVEMIISIGYRAGKNNLQNKELENA